MRCTITVLLFLCFVSSISLLMNRSLSPAARRRPRVASAPLNLNDAPSNSSTNCRGSGRPWPADCCYRDEHGRFKQVEQLNEVKGIGVRTLEKLRPHLTLN